MGDDYIDIPLSSIGGDRPHLQLQPNWPSLAPNTNFPINSYSLNSPYCNTLYTNTLYRVLSFAYTSPGKLPLLERLPNLVKPFRFWKGPIP